MPKFDLQYDDKSALDNYERIKNVLTLLKDIRVQILAWSENNARSPVRLTVEHTVRKGAAGSNTFIKPTLVSFNPAIPNSAIFL